MRQQLLDHAVSGSPGWMFAVHLYTADATKARVWQDSAIHTTMVTSAFTSEPVLGDSEFDDVCGGLEERFLMGDLQGRPLSTGWSIFGLQCVPSSTSARKSKPGGEYQRNVKQLFSALHAAK